MAGSLGFFFYIYIYFFFLNLFSAFWRVILSLYFEGQIFLDKFVLLNALNRYSLFHLKSHKVIDVKAFLIICRK
jgi:hypothetical protein